MLLYAFCKICNMLIISKNIFFEKSFKKMIFV